MSRRRRSSSSERCVSAAARKRSGPVSFRGGNDLPNTLSLRRMSRILGLHGRTQLHLFTARLEQLGFTNITVEHLQLRVAPSVAHIPWVTLKLLLTDVVFGKRKMTRARWNNVLAPVLLPLVSAPLGPMTYCMITATKRASLR